MKKALGGLLVIAVLAGIVPLARSIEKSHFTSRREGTSLRVAECPNAKHTPLYGI